jgi:hypothetical protein
MVPGPRKQKEPADNGGDSQPEAEATRVPKPKRGPKQKRSPKAATGAPKQKGPLSVNGGSPAQPEAPQVPKPKRSPKPKTSPEAATGAPRPKGKLSVDITAQAALGAEVPPEEDLTHAVYRMICQAADFLHSRGERRGALIVIGHYASLGEVPKARGDLRPNPFQGLYVSAGDKAFQRLVIQGAVAEGAVIAEESGQILGGGIMLAIDNYKVAVPAGWFMRHVAAASTSLRSEVKSVITLSEEANIARIFEKGKVIAEYDPAAIEAVEAGAGAAKPRQVETKPRKDERPAATATSIVPVLPTAPAPAAPAAPAREAAEAKPAEPAKPAKPKTRRVRKKRAKTARRRTGKGKKKAGEPAEVTPPDGPVEDAKENAPGYPQGGSKEGSE